jgi:ketosteroid isomerase-like protein
MEAEEIKTVRLFNDAINRHDVDDIGSFMTENHTFIDSGGGKTTGRDNMKAGWKQFFEMFPNYRNEIYGYLQSGSIVMGYGQATGTYDGSRGLVAENRISMPAAWRAVVDSGLVREWQVYADWSEAGKIIEDDRRVGEGRPRSGENA